MFRIKREPSQSGDEGENKKDSFKKPSFELLHFLFFLAGNEMRVGGLLTRLVGLRTGE